MSKYINFFGGREISIRSWDTINKKMFYSESICNCSDRIWMMSTGILDANGVDMFEGDYIKYTSPYHQDKIFMVSWDKSHSRFFKKILVNGSGKNYDTDELDNHMIIVGNFFAHDIHGFEVKQK